MIDSHCHLADRKFDADLGKVIKNAHDAGITNMITIADSLDEAKKCIEIAEKFDSIFATVGVHPHNAKGWEEGSGDELKKLVSSSVKVKAIGEIGLDYHYMNSPKEVQQEVFQIQLTLAQELHLPVVVHNRESIADLKRILLKVNLEKVVLHCCTEKWDDVKDLVERGYLLSFTGITTYENASDIRETILQCPIEQMMIETDAPYLAPLSHRGKRNEPAFVVEVAQCISAVKGVSVAEVDAITAKNAIEFFSLSP